MATTPPTGAGPAEARAGQLKQVFILKTGVRIPLGSLGFEIDRCLSLSPKTGVRIPLGSFTFEKDTEPIGCSFTPPPSRVYAGLRPALGVGSKKESPRRPCRITGS